VSDIGGGLKLCPAHTKFYIVPLFLSVKPRSLGSQNSGENLRISDEVLLPALGPCPVPRWCSWRGCAAHWPAGTARYRQACRKQVGSTVHMNTVATTVRRQL
jgi:hypothetical protein